LDTLAQHPLGGQEHPAYRQFQNSYGLSKALVGLAKRQRQLVAPTSHSPSNANQATLTKQR